MSAEKNHEHYLEEIEIAVAQTTKTLMEEHNSDLRKLAKVCAEKQLQVKRLKEFQENDRKTIRSLRAKLAEAIEEIECRNSTWETKEGEYEGEIVELKEENDLYKEELDVAHHEYDKLKDEKQGICSKYHADFCELEKLREQLDEQYSFNYYKQVKELTAENKKLKGREIEKVFGVSEEVFKKLLKECPPDPDDYK